MISGTTSVDLARDTASISRRSRSGLITKTFGSGGLPTDVLTLLSGTTYQFNPTGYWWNQAEDTATDGDRAYKHHFILHAGSGNLNKLVIYIHGHEGDDWNTTESRATTDIEIVKTALPDHDILQTWLLGFREQTADGVFAQRGFPVKFNDIIPHLQLANSIPGLVGRLHTWPFIAAINHFIGTYDKIYIMGHSGGGVIALWVGAMDTRISATFPLAAIEADWNASGGDGETLWGLDQASLLGRRALAAENWCRDVWNRNDNVIIMNSTDMTTVQTAVQAVSANYRISDINGAGSHGLAANYITTDIVTDLASL